MSVKIRKGNQEYCNTHRNQKYRIEIGLNCYLNIDCLREKKCASHKITATSRSSTAPIVSGIETSRVSIPDVKTEPKASSQVPDSMVSTEGQENTKKADLVEENITKDVSSPPFRKTF